MNDVADSSSATPNMWAPIFPVSKIHKILISVQQNQFNKKIYCYCHLGPVKPMKHSTAAIGVSKICISPTAPI